MGIENESNECGSLLNQGPVLGPTIPEKFFVQAGAIVSSQRPVDVPSTIEIYDFKGLKHRHDELLNSIVPDVDGDDFVRRTIARIRRLYAGDARAQKQIDAYDPSSEYFLKLTEYTALRRADNVDSDRLSELENWFREYNSNP